MVWEVVPIRGNRRGPPAVRWFSTWSPGKQPLHRAFLSDAAASLAFEIAREQHIRRPAIAVLMGQGEDTGRFALAILRYQGRHNPTRAALNRIQYSFSAYRLIEKQPTGYSLLTRQGRFLLGDFGTLYAVRPHRRSGVRATAEDREEWRQRARARRERLATELGV